MKRPLYLLSITVLYIIAISMSLELLPFHKAPDVFSSLFTKKTQGYLAWMKIREVVVVGFIAFLVAMLFVHKNKEEANVDSWVVGVLTFVLALALRLTVIGGEAWGWLEITDYLAAMIAPPALVAFLWKTRWRR